MRVLHVIEATIGGTRRHVVDVARGQAARGVEVWLVASALREPAFRDDLRALAADGVRCVELPFARAVRPGRDGRHLLELARLLERVRPDVVHTHSSKAGVVGRLASLHAGVGARVHTPHTFAFLFRSMFGPLQRGLYREVERALAGATQALVAVSAGEGATMSASGVVPAERVRVVPNGIDPGPWLAATPRSRSELGVPEGVPLAAVIGLLNVAKGQDLALRALAQPGLDALHLLIAGHGEDRGGLEALARALGVQERVRFLGWRDDAPALLAACDLLWLPSRWEGLPYIVLEAMASGLPVVATRVDGALELVEDGRTGFLAALEDPAGLADGARRVLALSPAQRARMGASGRERVLERYTVERMVEGLLEVYAEVA